MDFNLIPLSSYYQYSAGEGFFNIEGYDLFDSSKGLDLTVEKKIVPNSIFLVHAIKAPLPSLGKDIYPFIDMSMKGTRNMDAIDKKFVVNFSTFISISLTSEAYLYLLFILLPQGNKAQFYSTTYRREQDRI